jgi:general secretion pathway protein A
MPDLSRLGLAEAPFSRSPDPRFLYLSAQHRTALAKISYTVEHREGLSALYGDVGVGKTSLARRLRQIYHDHPQYSVAYLPMPTYPSEFQFLKAICAEFELPPKRSQDAQIDLLRSHLQGMHDQGHDAVLIVDEAQELVGGQFDLLAAIVSFQSAGQALLQVVMIGQHDLRVKLRIKDELRARIVISSTLEPLDPRDTRDMVRYRVMAAGRADPLFTEEALQRIYAHTHGLPRDVCALSHRALSLALEHNRDEIDADLIERASQA